MKLFMQILKILLKIRYRINITWLELLDYPECKLILPSHVALVDPIILYILFREKWKVAPVITESFYNIPILKSFFRKIWAISVVDLAKDKNKNLDADAIMWQMISALNRGNHVLLYPQWTLARQWFQSIVGKKTAFFATQQSPKDTKILTVNIEWLRWSRSSRAWTGSNPNLAIFLLKGLRFTIANLFFFVPKRNVNIAIQDSTSQLRKSATKWMDLFNQQLEKIYNVKWEEKIHYISGLSRYDTVKNHHTPTKIGWSIADLKKASFSQSVDIPADLLKKISSVIQKIKPEFKEKITVNTNLILDCFFDSLDMAELKTTIKSAFLNSSNPPLLDLKTVWDVAMMAMWKSIINEEMKSCDWIFTKENKLAYTHIHHLIKPESTILSVMKDSFKNNKSDSFCYDTIFGVQSKKDFLIKAYLIANLLKKIPWERIAIMLPSLSATSLLICWCYLAKKIPVMLNRTQSNEAFSHCIKSQNVWIILTSKSFFQKIQTPRLKKYEMTFFEDLLKDISLTQKLKAVYDAMRFQIPNDISQTAVVLFTSWSEALPKTVELSHKNILQDLLGAAGMIWLKKKDIEICFLPPFHSFGFILWVAMPLISWARIVFTPDPNDSRTISNLIQHTKSSRLASTPTFLNGVVQSSKESQLDSLRLAIVWAEKCPKELFTRFSKKSPSATIIEWYWITECSPIISVNPFKPNAKIKRGTVWLPILWEEVKILDIETNEELWAKKEWMIYVNGSNIFAWYWDQNLESPFLEIDWKQRYKTWDLWFLDKDGYLTISGRLKRFVKIAWEMISLPAIETVLSRKWKSNTWIESLAIESEEDTDWSVRLILFSTEKITIAEANKYLREQWISNLVSIDEVIKLNEIPMLGTWKVDYVQLKWFLEKTSTKQARKTTIKSQTKK